MIDETKLHLYTDDTGIPYENDKNPFPRTARDDEIEADFIKEFGLALAEDEDYGMMTPYEQAIIEKVKKQGEENIKLMSQLLCERDDIPSMFSRLTDEEFNYFVENRESLMPHLEYLNELFNNLGKNEE